MNINIKLFFILFLILSFFCDLVCPLFISNWTISVAVFFAFFCFFLLLIFFHKNFILDIQRIIKNKNNSLNLYLLFVTYILLITFIMGIIGKVLLVKSLLGIIGQYILSVLVYYLVFIYIAYKILKPKLLIKIVYTMLFVILVLGIVDFIAYYFNIVFLQKILLMGMNIQVIRYGAFTKVYSMGLPRVQSVYFEPGFFAEYIFFLLPIIYKLSLSKFNIYKNKNLNIIIKRMMIPLLWINLILTQSPIFLVFALISTLIYFWFGILNLIKTNLKRFIRILFVLLFFGVSLFPFIYNINLNDTYAGRITKVISNLNDINVLIYSEQSFGTRLCNIINLVDIGLRSPLFGVGHSNLIPLMEKQIINNRSPVFVTDEIKKNSLQEIFIFQNPPFTNIFVRYGLIGLILFYAFIIKTILSLIKIRKYTRENTKQFIDGLIGTLFSYIVISCYDITIASLIPCIPIGLSIGLIQYIYENREKEKLNNENILKGI